MSLTAAELYDAHSAAVFAFALHLLRNESAARDVLQSVFVSIARSAAAGPAPLPGVENHRAWLLKLTHWQILDLLRRDKAATLRETRWSGECVPLFAPAADPDTRLMDESLSAALMTLPEDQRAVVHLHLWEGFTFDRLAETLGISRNTAASRYRLALEKLRPRLQPLYDEIR
jgi:RNA polymerase sigma-70 factor (ECF subfamily)